MRRPEHPQRDPTEQYQRQIDLLKQENQKLKEAINQHQGQHSKMMSFGQEKEVFSPISKQ